MREKERKRESRCACAAGPLGCCRGGGRHLASAARSHWAHSGTTLCCCCCCCSARSSRLIREDEVGSAAASSCTAAALPLPTLVVTFVTCHTSSRRLRARVYVCLSVSVSLSLSLSPSLSAARRLSRGALREERCHCASATPALGVYHGLLLRLEGTAALSVLGEPVQPQLLPLLTTAASIRSTCSLSAHPTTRMYVGARARSGM